MTHAGTLGHWKSIADAFLKDGIWTGVIAASGVPTFLIGDAEDPEFERHVRQGPYFVIDDAAPERYRSDPRVHYLRGHPVLHTMLPEMLKGLGVSVPAAVMRKGQDLMRVGQSRLLYVPPMQTVKDMAAVALLVAAAGAFGWVASTLIRRAPQPATKARHPAIRRL